MKIRPARSFERAVTQIIHALGEEEAAKAVKRSTSLIRKWSDPDNPALPSIQQALDLDKAFVRTMKEPAPLHAVYLHRLDKAFEDIGPETETLVMALFNLHASIGLITRTLVELLESNGYGKVNLSTRISLSPISREILLTEIEKASEELDDLEKSVRRH